MAAKADYRTLEHEYVTTDISIRALAIKASVAFSAVAKKSRELEWPRKRAEYQAKAREMAMMDAMERLASEATDIRIEAITAMRATVYKYMENLQNDRITVGTKEAVQAVEKLLLMLGEVTERKETHVVSDSLSGRTTEELGELLRVVRARVVDGRTLGPGNGATEETRPH
jgi:uncharacterized protein YbjQ (UPF0145 family)